MIKHLADKNFFIPFITAAIAFWLNLAFFFFLLCPIILLFDLWYDLFPEKATAAHSRVFVWRIPGTEKPGGL